MLLGSTAYSQSKPKKIKPYTARILLANGEKVRGMLYAATEESIILRDRYNDETTVLPTEIESVEDW